MRNPLLSFLDKHQYLLPLGVFTLTFVMLFLMLVPTSVLGSSQLWSYDKIGHFLLFGSWTYILGLYKFVKTRKRPGYATLFFAGIFFGSCIELLQYSLPVNRSADPFDLLFDGLGCLVAIYLLYKTINFKR